MAEKKLLDYYYISISFQIVSQNAFCPLTIFKVLLENIASRDIIFYKCKERFICTIKY